jgi:ribosomal-protein-alanine N-acetyltransferase
MKELFELFPTIETERLVLRKMTLADAANVFEYFSDELVTRYFGIENFTKLEEAEEIIKAFNNGYEKKAAIRWGIALSETNEIIGSIGFHNINRTNSRVEVGYEITRKEWNKGYATEALLAAIAFMFETVGVNRIGATVRPENIPSQQMLKKIGFYQEGVLEDYQFTRGKFHHLIMFSLLQRKFLK